MNAYGTHVITELSQCQNISKFDDLKAMEALMWECAMVADLSPLSVHAHKFSPQGISALVILQESHLSVHVFPELGYAALDCYTCGHHNELKAHVASTKFILELGATSYNQRTIHRGIEKQPGIYDTTISRKRS